MLRARLTTTAQAAKPENIAVLSPDVPGNRLNEVIHNPIDSRIDEG